MEDRGFLSFLHCRWFHSTIVQHSAVVSLNVGILKEVDWTAFLA